MIRFALLLRMGQSFSLEFCEIFSMAFFIKNTTRNTFEYHLV